MTNKNGAYEGQAEYSDYKIDSSILGPFLPKILKTRGVLYDCSQDNRLFHL